MVSRLVGGQFSKAPCEERGGKGLVSNQGGGERLTTGLRHCLCPSVHLCCNISMLAERSKKLKCTYLAGTTAMLSREPSYCHHGWM